MAAGAAAAGYMFWQESDRSATQADGACCHHCGPAGRELPSLPERVVCWVAYTWQQPELLNIALILVATALLRIWPNGRQNYDS